MDFVQCLHETLVSTFLNKKNFKTESHGTIYIFKIFFTIMFLVFNNKRYSNKFRIRKRKINSDSINNTITIVTMYFYITLHSVMWVDFGICTLPPSIGMLKDKT